MAIWMAIGCAFNALLIDHTESLLFALLVGIICSWLHEQAVPTRAGATSVQVAHRD
jgi:hypothetical protein